jgi:signal peptidase I
MTSSKTFKHPLVLACLIPSALLVGFCFLCVAVRLFFDLSFYQVHGPAMAPNLVQGDRVLVRGGLEEINRGEIIVFSHPQNNYDYVMRVIALPGETIRADERAFGNSLA